MSNYAKAQVLNVGSDKKKQTKLMKAFLVLIEELEILNNYNA